VRGRASAVLGLAAAIVAAGCTAPESAAQRVTRARQQHRILPNGFQMRAGDGGAPEVVVSVLVVNDGKERLDRVTLRVHVQGTDGRDRASALAVLDTAALVPGVSAQLSAVARGLDVRDGESLLVELEDAPAAAEIAGYPEYAGAAEAAR
jgi:hypothetical protein